MKKTVCPNSLIFFYTIEMRLSLTFSILLGVFLCSFSMGLTSSVRGRKVDGILRRVSLTTDLELDMVKQLWHHQPEALVGVLEKAYANVRKQRIHRCYHKYGMNRFNISPLFSMICARQVDK